MNQPALLTVLIADDEPPARRHLRGLLEREPDVRVVGEAASGGEAIDAIRELEPDLVFLDVQMPEGDGFEVVRAIGAENMPVVVFATAYDSYALRAFEAHALDYLLKPFERERFEMALRRARLEVQRTRGQPLADPKLLALLHRLDGRASYLDRVSARVGNRTRLIEVDEVDYFEGASNYVNAQVAGRSFLVRTTLSGLEAKLDPRRFRRVHRSVIVNLSRVLEVESLFAGEYVLFLRNGQRLTTGRTYRAAVQDALNLRS